MPDRRTRYGVMWALSMVLLMVVGSAANDDQRIAAIPGAEVLNDVVFTQVCASFGDDETTRAVVDAMLADGTAWTTGSRWRGRAVLRVSVSNWSTTAADVAASLDALRRAAAR